MTGKAQASPVERSERIGSIDVLRGFAVLGILLMNVQDFSMIGAAYFNPTAYGDLTGVNWVVWLGSHLFADMKFITLFSLLFGAGVVLFADRIEARGGSAVGIHYRRMFWLMLFGMIHGYLLWRGDILFAYAICGFLVFPLRHRSPVTLLVLGLFIISVGSTINLLGGMTEPKWSPEEREAMISDTWAPNEDDIARELAAYRGSYLEQMKDRVPDTASMQTITLLYYFLWRCGGLMLIGMALFKWGVLSAKLSAQRYLTMLLVGLGIGIPLVGYGVHQNIEHHWAFGYSFFIGSQYNYWGSLCVAAAYIAIVMLLFQYAGSGRALAPLAATGRMAFTNYIMQSVICTTIFYGHGLGLYGSVERSGQIILVLAIWVFQIVMSTWWLARFRFGPLEWLWRCLTYWQLQPIRTARSL